MQRPDPDAPPIGWPLLPKPDADGRLRFPSLAASVRQSIEVLLRTRPGEQLMRPGFGAGLANFLQEPNTTTTRRRISDAISAALNQYEPRILLDRVEVSEVPGQPTHIRVEIAYRLRRTGLGQQMSLTLMLEG
ncbi:MAG TPA: GPW/gp25 family protein [Roseiflexaceae bacterium]|nr:GPW/gp25 family protein [Roseiflexaceae bacterium]